MLLILPVIVGVFATVQLPRVLMIGVESHSEAPRREHYPLITPLSSSLLPYFDVMEPIRTDSEAVPVQRYV